MRIALPILEELIEEYPVTIALLPTGYGKSRFFQYNPRLIGKLAKIAHILPLRAIVSELANDLRSQLGEQVSYQAGIYVEGVSKTPFLTARYTIVTFDSFFMNFYGIPVSELWRSVWHSDVAFLLSRISHTILDEVHLVVTPDEIDKVEKEFSKVVSIIRNLVEWNFKVGLKTIILTATFYPWIFKHILTEEVSHKTVLLLYAPENHEYSTKVRRSLANVAKVKLVWSNEDDFYKKFKNYVEKVPTYLHYESMENFLDSFSGYNLGDKVAIMFNSVRRCINAYEKYRRQLQRQGYETTILHGRMTSYAREKSFEVTKNARRIVLFSTQVIEAGVNFDFNTLITEAAPPHALIQRIGRVARHGVKGDQHYAIRIILGGENLLTGVHELCKGIYSTEFAVTALRYLASRAEDLDGSCRKVAINWRLPEQGEIPDYLKLLAVTREPPVLPIAGRISSFLEQLTNWRARAKTLKPLDEIFHGSFIRSSTLIPIYLGPLGIIEGEKQLNELLTKYTITVDINFIRKHGTQVLDVQEVDGRKKVKLAIVINDYWVEVTEGPTIKFLLKYPLQSLHQEVSKQRRRRKEVEGEFSRVFLLGLKAEPHIKFDVEKGYISW